MLQAWDAPHNGMHLARGVIELDISLAAMLARGHAGAQNKSHV